MKKPELRKEKTREYLEGLMDEVGLGDKQMAKIIKKGLASESATERIKAFDALERWRGAKDVDKKVGGEVEPLPIGNIDPVDLDRISNRCNYCRHKEFKPIEGVLHFEKIPEPKEPKVVKLPPLIEELEDEPNNQETTG